MSLQVNELRKTFGTKVAVDGISFEMTEPGVFGLIGTNGAGKTTTIRMILGIMPPDSGNACWDGKAINRDTLAFGYMPEERGIYMKNKVGEQLIYFGMLRGMTKAAAKEAAVKLCTRLEVMQYFDMTAEKLSKGNQQKIQLVATLIHDPKLIFLDEPFSGLDPVNAVLLSSVIHELVDAGKYIVMSSHQMNTVEEYCRNLIILSDGKTVLNGNLAKIKAGYGHTTLIVSESDETLRIAGEMGLVLRERRAGELVFGITGDDMARAFLHALFEKSIYPVHYCIAEPSLSEIFIEKVGASK